jgi:hypothetical protein
MRTVVGLLFFHFPFTETFLFWFRFKKQKYNQLRTKKKKFGPSFLLFSTNESNWLKATCFSPKAQHSWTWTISAVDVLPGRKKVKKWLASERSSDTNDIWSDGQQSAPNQCSIPPYCKVYRLCKP